MEAASALPVLVTLQQRGSLMQGHTASQNQDRSDQGGADLPVLQCTTTVFLPFLNCLTIGAITSLSLASFFMTNLLA